MQVNRIPSSANGSPPSGVDSDSLIKKYWSKREAAGIMQNKIIVDGLLSSKPDFNNYFHKRIVVAEFSF
jgi:hypothetical protein